MTLQQRQKLILITLILCLAYLPAGQSFASGMESMDSMSEFCPGCDIEKTSNEDNRCGSNANCLTNSCTSSFSVYETVFLSSNKLSLNPRLILKPGYDHPSEFQSQPPGSLYRPPITWIEFSGRVLARSLFLKIQVYPWKLIRFFY